MDGMINREVSEVLADIAFILSAYARPEVLLIFLVKVTKSPNAYYCCH